MAAIVRGVRDGANCQTITGDGPGFSEVWRAVKRLRIRWSSALAHRAPTGRGHCGQHDLTSLWRSVRNQYQFEVAVNRSLARCSAQRTKEVVAACADSGSPVRNAEIRTRNLSSQSIGLSESGSSWWQLDRR